MHGAFETGEDAAGEVQTLRNYRPYYGCSSTYYGCTYSGSTLVLTVAMLTMAILTKVLRSVTIACNGGVKVRRSPCRSRVVAPLALGSRVVVAPLVLRSERGSGPVLPTCPLPTCPRPLARRSAPASARTLHAAPHATSHATSHAPRRTPHHRSRWTIAQTRRGRVDTRCVTALFRMHIHMTHDTGAP